MIILSTLKLNLVFFLLNILKGIIIVIIITKQQKNANQNTYKFIRELQKKII